MISGQLYIEVWSSIIWLEIWFYSSSLFLPGYLLKTGRYITLTDNSEPENCILFGLLMYLLMLSLNVFLFVLWVFVILQFISVIKFWYTSYSTNLDFNLYPTVSWIGVEFGSTRTYCKLRLWFSFDRCRLQISGGQAGICLVVGVLLLGADGIVTVYRWVYSPVSWLLKQLSYLPVRVFIDTQRISVVVFV